MQELAAPPPPVPSLTRIFDPSLYVPNFDLVRLHNLLQRKPASDHQRRSLGLH